MKKFGVLFILLFISLLSFAQRGIIRLDTLQSEKIQADSSFWIKYLEEGGDTVLSIDKGKVKYILNLATETWVQEQIAASGTGNATVTDSATLVFNETPSGLINGVNAVFTTAHNFITNTTSVFLNGIRQILGIDYSEGSNTITFNTGYIPETDDYLTINYLYLPPPSFITSSGLIIDPSFNYIVTDTNELILLSDSTALVN